MLSRNDKPLTYMYTLFSSRSFFFTTSKLNQSELYVCFEREASLMKSKLFKKVDARFSWKILNVWDVALRAVFYQCLREYESKNLCVEQRKVARMFLSITTLSVSHWLLYFYTAFPSATQIDVGWKKKKHGRKIRKLYELKGNSYSVRSSNVILKRVGAQKKKP